MTRVRVHNFVMSLDGFCTGEDQTRDAAFGTAHATFLAWFGAVGVFDVEHPDGAVGMDQARVGTWGQGIGAEIMGRHKFDPTTGPWQDDGWIGWWGRNPPFHTPCYVLTHYPRPSIELDGGTTFHFVSGPPAQVIARVRADIGPDQDIRVGGGVDTVREYLLADVVDFLHLIQVPVVLGRGKRLWDGLAGIHDRFAIESVTTPSGVTHLTFTRR